METAKNNTAADRLDRTSQRILRHLISISGSNEIATDPDLPIYERHLFDSMKTVEFLIAIEEEFGLYISPAELDRQTWATSRKIIADIQRRLNS